MEGFEEFDQYRSRSVKSLFVTIQRRGNFSLNRAVFKALGEPAAIKLLFNPSKRQVGFRSANANDIRSVPVRRQGNSDTYMVAGLTFCKEYDIDTTTARRYEGRMQDGMLIIDLNGSSTDATGPRLRNDVSGELQGKRERRLARSIIEKAVISDNGIQVQASPTNQKSQRTIPVQKAKDVLNQEERIVLENALKEGDLSIHDILNLLKNVNNANV